MVATAVVETGGVKIVGVANLAVGRRGAGVRVPASICVRRGVEQVSDLPAMAVSGVADRGEKVAEGLVAASGIAGRIEVHE